MVTINPKQSNMHTPMRCFSGICKPQTIGIGRTVVRRSDTEFSTPPPSMTCPSSRHLPFGRGGKIQYASTGLHSISSKCVWKRYRGSLRAQPYRQHYEYYTDRHGPCNAQVKHPVKPLDSTILDQAIVEAYQRQSNECRCECEGEFGNESDYIGCLDHRKRYGRSTCIRDLRVQLPWTCSRATHADPRYDDSSRTCRSQASPRFQWRL